jgi:ABC-2 type transport system permease protein
MAGFFSSKRPAPAPLPLLLRVNLLQNWRRLKSIRQQSRLLTAVIGLFIVGYMGLSFWLFYRGLKFVATFPGLGTLLTERLLFLLFAFLFALLLLSNLVISYTNLFRNRETAFLMTLPISSQTIFRWKFLESTVLASWAFLFLIAPLLAAYGLTHKAEWHFYPVTLVLIALFIVLPAVAGSWLAVNVARYLDRRAFQVTLLAVAVFFIVSAAVWLKPEAVTDESLETRVLSVLDRLLMKTRFAQFPALPSYWLSAGVLNWSEGALAAAGFFLLVLLSHVLFFGFLAFNGMGRFFYDAASAVQSRGSVLGQWKWFRVWQNQRSTAAAGVGAVEWAFDHLSWVRPDVRALLVKDVRMFWRDTSQWGQTIMLFGLLGVYILNLRHFSQQLSNPFWIHLITYLNLGACSLNLATLTTRFVYPQFSLEGKRLWIVGLAPLGLARVVKAKFWLTGCASWVVTLGLISLSCYMLKLPFIRTIYFGMAVSVMTFTLTGLAVGLGVLYPNFKEENPSKIVSGFGGTFCLVLSFLYILGSVILLAISSPWAGASWGSPSLLLACWSGFGLLSLALGWLPFKLGLRKVASFEL